MYSLCIVATRIARQSVKCDLGVTFNASGQKLDIYYPSVVNGNILHYIL